MNLLVIVLLVVLWTSILVPGAVRGRHSRSPLASIDSFERSMGILAPEHMTRRYRGARPGRSILVLTDPRRVVQPRGTRRNRVLARRRAVLVGLSSTVVVAALLALLTGGAAVYLLIAVAAVLAAYVGLLLHLKSRGQQTRRVVRRLPSTRTQPAPEAREEALVSSSRPA